MRNTKNISLHGRTAVVTGSTRGIGRAIAKALGRAGARLVLSSSRPAAVAQAAQDMRAAGMDVIGVPCDVAQQAQVQQLRDAALAHWGQIDIWVNNAGIAGPFGYTLDVPAERWEQVLQVNVLGCYYGCTAVLPHMLERRYGKIINLSGGGARRAQRFLSAYSTSKAAIMRFSDGLARDYRPYRFLSINVLEPGIVPTDMLTHPEVVGPAADSLKNLPRVMQIFGTTAEEAGALALWMASDATKGRSGKVYRVMPQRRALWRLAGALFRRQK
jgi:NAD(P)-dependent dehydrogenase (short-subunit alcohol dehydrogenase family)